MEQAAIPSASPFYPYQAKALRDLVSGVDHSCMDNNEAAITAKLIVHQIQILHLERMKMKV